MRESRRDRLEAYLGRLFGYALSLTNDREQARELVQDCAVKALAARRVPGDAPAYRAWLFRILRNASIDLGRRKTEMALDEDAIDGRGPDDDEVWRGDERLISALTVRVGLARLSAAHREIIALVDIAGFNYAEAAAFLDIPKGTVMSRLSRARHALMVEIADGKVHPLPLDRRRALK